MDTTGNVLIFGGADEFATIVANARFGQTHEAISGSYGGQYENTEISLVNSAAALLFSIINPKGLLLFALVAATVLTHSTMLTWGGLHDISGGDANRREIFMGSLIGYLKSIYMAMTLGITISPFPVTNTARAIHGVSSSLRYFAATINNLQAATTEWIYMNSQKTYQAAPVSKWNTQATLLQAALAAHERDNLADAAAVQP